MSDSRKRLRDLLAGPGHLLVPEALSAGTARMAEVAGFEAVYIGGHAMGVLHHAIPDHGLIHPSEMVEHARRIADVVEIPLICDGDQGGETALNTFRTIRDFERAGAAAVHIEDTRNPKHLYSDDSLVPVAEMQARIRAAVDARRDPNFVVIARTDCAFNKGPVEETIERGCAYAEAGADAYFACRMSPDEVVKVSDAVPIPVMDMNHPRAFFETTKLKINVSAGMVLRGLLMKNWAMLQELKETGRIEWEGGDFLGMPRAGGAGLMDELVRDEEYLHVAERWAAALAGRPASR
jgi:2-methylisocitrate lyase-like PEP mutase family enzyme